MCVCTYTHTMHGEGRVTAELCDFQVMMFLYVCVYVCVCVCVCTYTHTMHGEGRVTAELCDFQVISVLCV